MFSECIWPPEITSNIFACAIALCSPLSDHLDYDGDDNKRRPMPLPRLYQEDDHERYYHIHNQRRDIALVCKRWYAILCSDPFLWVDIVYSGQAIEETLPLWIGRTGSLPLNVFLHLPWREYHTYSCPFLLHIHPVSHAEELSDRLFRLFIPLRHRIRVLDISSACSVQMAALLKYLGPFMNGHLIESVGLRHSDLCDEFSSSYLSKESPVKSFLALPKSSTLRHLAVAYLPLSTIASYPQLFHLTALDVRLPVYNATKSWSTFRIIAGRAVQLRTLRLTVMVVPLISWKARHTLVKLPCLDVLTLVLNRSRDAEVFMQSFYVPKLCRLSVDWTTDPTSIREFSSTFSVLVQHSLSRLTFLTISCLLVDKRLAEEAVSNLQNLEVFVLFNIDIPNNGTSLFLDIMLHSCSQQGSRIELNPGDPCAVCPKLKALHTYDSDGRREISLLKARRRLGFDFACTVNDLII